MSTLFSEEQLNDMGNNLTLEQRVEGWKARSRYNWTQLQETHRQLGVVREETVAGARREQTLRGQKEFLEEALAGAVRCLRALVGSKAAALAVYMEGRRTWTRPGEAMSHWKTQCLKRCCGMEVDVVRMDELEARFVAVHPTYEVVEADERPPRPPRRDTALAYVTEGLGVVVPQIAPGTAKIIATSLQAVVKVCGLALEAEHGNRYQNEEQYQMVLGHLGMMLRVKREAGPLETFQGVHVADEEDESEIEE